MINVDQITARLAKMPDTALQQYAAMHKNDPYIMALAVSESNRRKQVRQAAQGAQGEMEQPKVADQALAEMAPQVLPEEQGIAQLPVGDMEFAGGGLVAFAGGGDVERYAPGGMPPTSEEAERLLREARARAAQRAAMRPVGPHSVFPRAVMPAAAGPLSAALIPAAVPIGLAGALVSGMEGMREEGYPVDTTAPEFATEATPEQIAFDAQRVARARALAAPSAPSTPSAPAAAAAGSISPEAMAQARTPRTGVESTTSTYTRSGRPAPGAPSAPAAPGTKPAGGPGAAPVDAAATAAASGIAGLDVGRMTADALRVAGQQPNPFAADVERVGKEKVKAAEEKVKGLEAIHKQFSDIFKGRKERLDTREAEIGKMKDQNIGLSLLQAGATMMFTPGGVGAALGKGVKVGTEQYAAGLDRLRGAQEKLLDARDRLEEIENQRSEMSARELFTARNEVKNIGISVKEDLIKSNMQMYGVNRDTAMKMVEQQIKLGISVYEQQQQTKRTGMSNAATLEAARIAAASRATGRDSEMEEYTKWLKENPQYMANPQAGVQAFLKAKAAISGFTNTTLTDKPAGRERE
jgi:hypothetical protein